jgi:cellulose synthase/poly-beta-1,6-N-acetylglucosamine synthase-like glycosyltransferase
MLSLLNAFTLLLAVLFVAYVLLILVPFLRYPKVTPGDPDRFHWHFFIPCRDEAAVIATTIERARRDFPGAHIWVIDDDSDDDTAAIAGGYAAADPQVHVVQRRRPDARTGKGDALNAAYHELNRWLPQSIDRSRTVITVIDADGEMAPNALEVVSADNIFGDARIGAAQIAVWMKNRADKHPYPDSGWWANAFARSLLRLQDLEFRTVIAAMQSLRARTGTVGLGGNGQFTRLDVLDAIGETYGEPWHGALLEDYELGVHVLLAGYRIKHVYDTHVSQEALPSLRRLLTQRTRWAQGNIQCVKYIPAVIRSRHFDNAGVVETCYYLLLPFLQMVGAFAFAILTASTIVQALNDPAAYSIRPDQVWSLIGLILLFSVAPFAVWGFVYKIRCEPQASWWTALLWGLGVWLYVYYMYVCIARAFWRLIRGKTGWAKTRRNAEAHVVGATAIER